MRFATRLALVTLMSLCMTRDGFAQSTNSGDIRGTVTDSSGAAVGGAKVTLSNIDTGETKDFTTNANGIYDTVSTRPGNYNLTFSKEGFKELTRGPIVLHVSIITEDATLQVGRMTEVMHVEADGAPLLETESGQQGTIFEAKTIGELPQIGAGITGNDWANFNILLPGAAGSPTQPMSEGSGAYNAGDAVSINGNLPNYANYLQDGGVVQLPVSNNVDNTLFSALQEVQITTSSFSAQYGIGGAVFNQITKSGNNTFHGSAYEYFQNSVLNAKPFFWVPNSAGGYSPQPVGYLRYDQYGGTVGGPIIKNKFFFFFAVDKLYNNGASNVAVGTVPTLAERGVGTANPGAYDFTGLPTLYDPNSCSTPGCTRTSFAAENTGSLAGVNAIPATAIDPVAAKILALYPSPNAGVPGALTNNFTTILPTPNPNLRYFGRLDYTLSPSNTMNFSISAKNNPGINKGGSFPCPINCFSGDIDGYNAQFTETWTISPTLVNEFRMAYTKQGNWFVPQSVGYDAATSLGLEYAKADVLPSINITGNGVCCSGIAPGTNAIYIENLYDPSDVVTMIKGRHILHFGVEVLMGQGNTTPWGNLQSGNFTFSGNYTSQNGAPTSSTGASFADFLLGDVQSWSATNQAVSYARLKSPQLFVQDDYKIKPYLTINLGLRYTATTGFTEIHNSLGGFDPNIPLIYPCPSAQFTNCSYEGNLGSMWFAGQNNRNSLQKPIYDIFLPRVGFAWTFMPNTVMRGGFGMYSYNFSQDDYGNGIGTGSLNTDNGSATDPNHGTGPTPLIYLNSSASTAASVLNYVVGSPNSRTPYTYLNLASPSNQYYVPYNVPVARINEWTLSVEHQFAGNFLASVAYVGSHAMNLQFGTDVNQITSATGLAASSAAGSALQADRPFPAWGSLGGYNYNAISNYNALQGAITKRYSHGLLFSANLVWSHMMDDQDSGGWGSRGGTQYWQIGNLPRSNYGNSNFDIPIAFKGYVSYELPFGHGKAYLTNGRVLDEIVGGWRIAGTFIAQSGNPFTVVMNNNENGTITGCASGVGGTASGGDVSNGCNWFPNVVGSVSGPKTTAQWFNTAAFVPAWNGSPTTVFAFGDEGRNILRGPRLSVVNLSLAKDFSFMERFHLALRADFVNALNHPSLGLPGQSYGAANFGEINAATQNGGVAVAPRSGQLSALFSF
jgi:Carboxypeptidase regulatory-like domain